MSCLTCPNCGEKLKEGERNCKYCGCLIAKIDTTFRTEEIVLEKEEKPEIILEEYKICPNCHASNKINQVVCTQCNTPLTDAEVVNNDDTLVRKLTEKADKKERHYKIAYIIYMVVVFVVSLLLLIKNPSGIVITMFVVQIIFIGLSLAYYFTPDYMFYLSLYHLWVENPEPSTFYYFQCKLSAVIVPMVGLSFIILA